MRSIPSTTAEAAECQKAISNQNTRDDLAFCEVISSLFHKNQYFPCS